MRHHLMMGGMMGGGLMGFMLHGMLRRIMSSLLIVGLLVAVGVLWTKLQAERARNRPPGW